MKAHVGWFAVLGMTAACSATSGNSAGAGSSRVLLVDPSNAEWTRQAPEAYQARFETTEGDFLVEVRREWSPHGADRFYNLVRNGWYDGVRFTRVVPGFIAQFGLHGRPPVVAAWKGRTIPDDPVRISNVRGTLAFAMTGPNTRTTHVYISLVDNTRLDAQGFSPFGRVTEGMAVVDSLYSGYGENSGGGIRAGRQGAIEQGGNAYLDREYPLLDGIRRARIVGGRER